MNIEKKKKKYCPIPRFVFFPKTQRTKWPQPLQHLNRSEQAFPWSVLSEDYPADRLVFSLRQDFLQAYRGQALADICKGHGETSFKWKQHFMVSEIQAHVFIHCKIKTIYLIFRLCKEKERERKKERKWVAKQWKNFLLLCVMKAHCKRMMHAIWTSSMILNVQLYHLIISRMRPPLDLHNCL